MGISFLEEAYLSYIKLYSAGTAYAHSRNGHLVLAVQFYGFFLSTNRHTPNIQK